MYKGRRSPREVVDAGDANVEVDPGDWAILKVKEADRPAGAEREPQLPVRVRRSDLPPRQRLLEGHHPRDRLCRPADAEQAGDLPHRRPPGRLGRRRAQSPKASSSAFQSAGCRATTASRSFFRCATEMFRQRRTGATATHADPFADRRLEARDRSARRTADPRCAGGRHSISATPSGFVVRVPVALAVAELLHQPASARCAGAAAPARRRRCCASSAASL